MDDASRLRPSAGRCLAGRLRTGSGQFYGTATGRHLSKISRRRVSVRQPTRNSSPLGSAAVCHRRPEHQQQQQQRRAASFYTYGVCRRNGCLCSRRSTDPSATSSLSASELVSVVDQTRIIGSRSLLLTCPTRHGRIQDLELGDKIRSP